MTEPTKLDIALNALKDLLVDTLETQDSNRFAKAATLAALTSKIAAQAANNLRDVKHLVHNGAGGQFAIGYGQAVGYDAPEYMDPDNGQGFIQGEDDVVVPVAIGAAANAHRRNVMARRNDIGAGAGSPDMHAALAVLQPILEGTAKSNHASVRQKQATELRELIDSRNLLDSATDAATIEQLQKRIDQLVAIIAEPGETHADVVPTELLRRHPTRTTDEGADEGHDLRPDGSGEAGDAGADPGGREGPSGGTVLEPHGRPPFGSGLDSGTEPGPERANLEGAEAPAEAAEAGAGPRERGALRGREDAGDDGAAARSAGVRDAHGTERDQLWSIPQRGHH